jgi:hypothetical protein
MAFFVPLGVSRAGIQVVRRIPEPVDVVVLGAG